jgi:hypothetical protein
MTRIALAAGIIAVLLVSTDGIAAAQSKTLTSRHEPTVKVELFGDSSAFTLGYSLGVKKVSDKYHFTLQDKGNIGCGLVSGPSMRFEGDLYHPVSACNGSPASPGEPLSSQPLTDQWTADIAKNHPNVVVFLAGRWEIVDRLYNGVWTNILNPTFAAYVQQQLVAATNIFTSGGANVVFVTAPCADEAAQPDGQPWPESDPARLAAYNTILREVAAENPTRDSVEDLSAVVCPGGAYSATYKGVTIRTTDGIHFTPVAGATLASALLPSILASGRAAIAHDHAGSSKGSTIRKNK